MPDPPSEIFKYNGELTRKIFSAKEEFHKRMAKLPVEEKIRILVELQKIALTVKPAAGPDDARMVWEID